MLLRLAMCAAAAIFLWAFTKAWDPPFSHRLGEVPHRNVIARVDFEQPDPAATNKAATKRGGLPLLSTIRIPSRLLNSAGN